MPRLSAAQKQQLVTNEMVICENPRVINHSPGGKSHDQKSHGRGRSFSDDPSRYKALTKKFPKSKAKKLWKHKKYDIGLFKADKGNVYDTDKLIAYFGSDVVGSLGITDRKDHLIGVIQVHPKHRRQGIASAMYDIGEEIKGKPFRPEQRHTKAAAAFWRARKSRTQNQTFNHTPGGKEHDQSKHGRKKNGKSKQEKARERFARWIADPEDRPKWEAEAKGRGRGADDELPTDESLEEFNWSGEFSGDFEATFQEYENDRFPEVTGEIESERIEEIEVRAGDQVLEIMEGDISQGVFDEEILDTIEHSLRRETQVLQDDFAERRGAVEAGEEDLQDVIADYPEPVRSWKFGIEESLHEQLVQSGREELSQDEIFEEALQVISDEWSEMSAADQFEFGRDAGVIDEDAYTYPSSESQGDDSPFRTYEATVTAGGRKFEHRLTPEIDFPDRIRNKVNTKIGGSAMFSYGFSDEAGSYQLTGKGNAREVMVKTSQQMAAALRRFNPGMITFTASREGVIDPDVGRVDVEGGRVGMYRFLTKTASKIFPGYKGIEVSPDNPESKAAHIFGIVREDAFEALEVTGELEYLGAGNRKLTTFNQVNNQNDEEGLYKGKYENIVDLLETATFPQDFWDEVLEELFKQAPSESKEKPSKETASGAKKREDVSNHTPGGHEHDQKSHGRKGGTKVTFGKHRGKDVTEVPDTYVRWAAENLDRKKLKEMFVAEQKRRDAGGKRKRAKAKKETLTEAFRKVPTGFKDERRILKSVSDEQFETLSKNLTKRIEKDFPDVDVSKEEIEFRMEMTSDSPAAKRPAAHRAFQVVEILSEAEGLSTHPGRSGANPLSTGDRQLDFKAFQKKDKRIAAMIRDSLTSNKRRVYENVTINISFDVRKEKLNGQNYLVAPASMLVPGVLNGSKGALFYPKSEVIRNVEAWNMMPLTLGHPTDENEKPTSARLPHIFERFGLGFVFNATGRNGKLDAEAWFDIARTNQLAPHIISNLENGRKIELSTGLFTDTFEVRDIGSAVYNDKPYTHIARNYRPDHLAVLVDTKGACSLEDGCGIAVNARRRLSLAKCAFTTPCSFVTNVIRKKGSKYVILSKKGKVLGTFDSEEAAKKRMKQIEFFKHKGE